MKPVGEGGTEFPAETLKGDVFFLPIRRQQCWSAVVFVSCLTTEVFSSVSLPLPELPNCVEWNSVLQLQFSKPRLSVSGLFRQWHSYSIAVISQAVLTLLGNTQEKPTNLRLCMRSARASVPTQSFPHPNNEWCCSVTVPAWPIDLSCTHAHFVVN